MASACLDNVHKFQMPNITSDASTGVIFSVLDIIVHTMTNNSVWSRYYQLRQIFSKKQWISVYRENNNSKTLNTLWKCEISGFIQSPWELRLTIHWLSSGGRPSTESFQKAGLGPASAAARSQSSQRALTTTVPVDLELRHSGIGGQYVALELLPKRRGRRSLSQFRFRVVNVHVVANTDEFCRSIRAS